MRTCIFIALIAACTALDEAPPPDAGYDPSDRTCTPQYTCNQLRAMTEPAPFAEAAIAGEVEILDDQDFYVCPWDMPPVSDITWTTRPLQRTDAAAPLGVGAIVVRRVGAQLECEWRSAIAVRMTATGICDPSEGVR